MKKYELEDQIEKLEYQLNRKEAQFDEVVSTNSKLTDQLKNLWDEVGCKNDMIRSLNRDVEEIKTDRNKYASRWRRCVADKYEKRREEDEKDKALLDKILNEGRTDN